MFGEWLLCDFHIHTNHSDGLLSLDEVIDLYGANGFDAIAITDHTFDRRTRENNRLANGRPYYVLQEDFHEYLQQLWAGAGKAWEQYNMLLLPGSEITNDHEKYHILGIDIKPSFCISEVRGPGFLLLDRINRMNGMLFSIWLKPY